jgi:hypothetical protein
MATARKNHWSWSDRLLSGLLYEEHNLPRFQWEWKDKYACPAYAPQDVY